MQKSKFKFSFILIFSVILTLGLSLSLQSLLANWTPPENSPPNCISGKPGCDAPVNVSDSDQMKDGRLGIGDDFDYPATAYPGNPPRPNKLLHLLETNAVDGGGNPINAELAIQSVEGLNQHWGIYHDRTSRDLVFWNGDNTLPALQKNIFTLTNEGEVKTNFVLQLGPNSNNLERGEWNPLWSAIAAGRALYTDEEFAQGNNSVLKYNNTSGSDGVVISWENGNGSQPNRSGKWLKIVHNGNPTSPNFGGFVQSISSRRNATFVQRFRANLPIGYKLNIGENSTGSNRTSYWLTPQDGTGKWEEYIRVVHSGNTGTFSTSGHVYVTTTNSSPNVFTWYLASCNAYEVDAPPGIFSGNVGIGINDPGSLFNTNQHFSPSYDANDNVLTISSIFSKAVLELVSDPTVEGQKLGAIYFTDSGGQADAHRQVAGIWSEATDVNTKLGGGRLLFMTKVDNNGTQNKMIFNELGYLGIGTNTPNRLLQVKGLIDFGGLNTKLGLNAGLNIVTGSDYNTFVGYEAGRFGSGASSTADFNTAIGFRTLYFNTEGRGNTAIGFRTLYFNTEGRGNTANGYAALHGNTTGHYNTANGYAALYSNYDGNRNVAFGLSAGRYLSNSTGAASSDYGVYIGSLTKSKAHNSQNEIVIGYNAIGAGSNSAVLGSDTITKTVLKGNVGIGTDNPASKLTIDMKTLATTEGLHISRDAATSHYAYLNIQDETNNPVFKVHESGNVGIGTDQPAEKLSVVGRISLNDGGNSIYLGENAGLNDEGTDNKNVGVGFSSLYSNTEGSNNTANGYQSLYSNTTGSYNTANGHSSLYSNTEGNFNTANGLGSLYSNNIGINNTANGYQSLYSNTKGYSNTANGFRSLHFNTGGRYNTANGFQSLYSNTEGDYNTANGDFSLLYNTTGSYNTALGVYSGRFIFDGASKRTRGDYSIYIGYESKAKVDGTNNEIVIGYNAIGAGSNTVTIGNSSITNNYFNGNVNADAFIYSSDKSLKENITPMENSLERIMQINGVDFNWKESGEKDFGVIAQDVKKQFPEVVHIDPKTGLLAVDYPKLIAPLIEAIKEQQKQIDELKIQINEKQ